MVIREVVSGQAGLPVANSTKSYWHKEPSAVLLGHRSTVDPPVAADVVIVGSGITGAFAAHFLKRDQKTGGQSVVMLEAREACWGATGRNGGHCQPIVWASEPAIGAFELKTYDFLKTFVEEHKVPCDWRSFAGVHAFESANFCDLAAHLLAELRRTHPHLADQVQLVGPDDKDDFGRPHLEALRVGNAKGAVVQRNAASLWPYKLVAYVLEQLLADFPWPDGFNLQTNTPVTAVVRQGDSKYPWTVRTPRGSIAARQVLLATNGYTSRLLPSFSDLIVPVRGQVGALQPPTSPALRLDHSYGFSEDSPGKLRGEYLVQRPLPGGEHIYGGGRRYARDQAVGVWKDDEIEEDVATFLRSELTPVLDLSLRGDGESVESRRELTASMEWTGIMGYSRDRNPWVGPVPRSALDTTSNGGDADYSGLYLCAGYTGHGMPVAALAAQEVVRMMASAADEDSVEAGDLPRAYLLTKGRLEEARKAWAEVRVQSANDPYGYRREMAAFKAAGVSS